MSSLRADDARRAGAPSLAALKKALSARSEDPAWRIGLAYAGPDPREALRAAVPDADEIATINARLDRLDAASSYGAWTRETLDLIDLNPTVRAPDLAARVGRETADFKKDVRKLKELGLTESLAIGYLLSPRGEAVVDAGLPAPRERAPRETGTPLPRNIGAPATRALREVGVTTLEQVAGAQRRRPGGDARRRSHRDQPAARGAGRAGQPPRGRLARRHGASPRRGGHRAAQWASRPTPRVPITTAIAESRTRQAPGRAKRPRSRRAP